MARSTWLARARKSSTALVLPMVASFVSAMLLNGTTAVDAVDCTSAAAACHNLVQAQKDAAVNQRRLSDIENKINDAQAQMRELGGLIRELAAEVAAQQAAIASTQREVDDLDRQIQLTRAHIDNQEAHVKVREDLLGQRLRAIDKHGSVNYIELFVTSANLNQLLDRFLIMRNIVAADKQMVQDLQQQKRDLQQLSDQLAVQRAQEAALLEQEKAQEAELEKRQKDEQDAYAFQAQLEAQYAGQRAELEREQAAIGGEINSLQAQYQAQLAALSSPRSTGASSAGAGSPVAAPPPVAVPHSSGFLWPEAARIITQPFGCTDLLGEPYWPSCASKHFHTGIDIGGAYGTPIYASQAGVVTDYPGATGYGNYVIMVHAGGYATLYGHLSGFAAGSGAVVGQGQVIGYEGSTGYSTGPHLHFEIRYNGDYQNPCAYLGC
jgi:murein DD-endopeptidase MepM/ murein hydrolase activator NlpD